MNKIFLFAFALFSLASLAQESVLNSGSWYHFATENDGVHRLNYEQLVGLGILTSPVSSDMISLFSNGPGMLPEENWIPRPFDLNEIPIAVKDQGDDIFGEGDFLLFYGADQTTWKYNPEHDRFVHENHLYEPQTHYFLSLENGASLRIENTSALIFPETLEATSYHEYALHEIDIHNYHQSGKNWYGEDFDDVLTLNFSFPFSNVIPDTPAKCFVDLVSRSYGTGNTNEFVVNAEGVSSSFEVINISSNYLNDLVRAAEHEVPFEAQDDIIDVAVTMNPFNDGSAARMNFMTVQAECELKKEPGEQLEFRNTSGFGENGSTSYTIINSGTNDVVWDITNFQNPSSVNTTYDGSNRSYSANHDIVREFICFSASECFTPTYLGTTANQSLKSQPFAEGFIVTHPDFLAQAQQLAQFHELNDNITVNVATTEQVYNEFSGGSKDITAIKDYLRYFYENAGEESEKPQYLCLLGDASYDPKGLVYENTDWVPTFQSKKSFALITSYCSDDYYGLLESDDSNMLDSQVQLGIGRIPAQTVQQAQIAVSKIINYHAPSNDGEWQQKVLFVADDEDNNIHMSQSNNLAGQLGNQKCALLTQKVFFDSFEQIENSDGNPRYPEATATIQQSLNSGALICNYTGHSGFSNWSSELVMVDSMFAQLENDFHLPLFFMANCEFSKYDSPIHNSGSETLLFNASGGAIACVSNSRPGYSSSNYAFNQNFNSNLFNDEDGEFPRLGDLIRYAKNNSISSTGMTHRSNNLIGDPMMRLNYPEMNISVTDINGTDEVDSDVVFPFSGSVNISGEILSAEGQLAAGFNGELRYLVLDGAVPEVTLANDNFAPFEFMDQTDTVAIGTADVIDGIFNFSAFIESNGNGQGGNGKVLLFATSSYGSASGCFTEFFVEQSPVSVNDRAPLEATIYPNPVQETLRIDLKETAQKSTLRIFDSAGNFLREESFGHQQFVSIDLRELKAGNYYLSISTDEQNGTIKVVKAP